MPMPIIPYGFMPGMPIPIPGIIPGMPPIIPGRPMPGGVAGVSGSSSASMRSAPASSSVVTISVSCSLTANSSTVRSLLSPLVSMPM